MIRSRISMRALLARINRKLAHQSESVRVTRGTKWSAELGPFYQKDDNFNTIVGKHVNPVSLGRELEVLKPWERVADFDHLDPLETEPKEKAAA